MNSLLKRVQESKCLKLTTLPSLLIKNQYQIKEFLYDSKGIAGRCPET